MNPHGTIEIILPQGNGTGSFNIFDSLSVVSDFADKSAPWHGTAISENPGHNSLFKNAGRNNVLKLKIYSNENSIIQLQ